MVLPLSHLCRSEVASNLIILHFPLRRAPNQYDSVYDWTTKVETAMKSAILRRLIDFEI